MQTSSKKLADIKILVYIIQNYIESVHANVSLHNSQSNFQHCINEEKDSAFQLFQLNLKHEQFITVIDRLRIELYT